MPSPVTNVMGKGVEAFAIFGAVASAYLAIKLACSIFSGLRAFMFSSGINFTKYGQWAVVTGATDGIGKAYAQELAKRGLNVILISRSLEKLRNVAEEIENKYKVKTKLVAIDFSDDVEIYDQIKQELANVDIGVLVNNVGVSHAYPQFFGEIVTDKEVLDMIKVNVTSLTMMTRIVLSGMIDRKKGGVIINVSSGSGNFPSPLLSEYSSTKAFVDFFSRSLQKEYESKGIIIQSVLPFFVATKMSKIRRASAMVPTPQSFARSALNTVGTQKRTYGCTSHALQAYIMELFPENVLMKFQMTLMMKARSKALSRMSKKRDD